jgi:hypothetical protein
VCSYPDYRLSEKVQKIFKHDGHRLAVIADRDGGVRPSYASHAPRVPFAANLLSAFASRSAAGASILNWIASSAAKLPAVTQEGV